MTKLILLLLSMALFSCGQKGAGETTATVTEVKKAPATAAPSFDADSAYAYIDKQVSFGYRIPIGNDLTAELDIFDGALNGVLLVEVEFPDESAARSFIPPKWFGEDVTLDPRYHNSNMSKGIRP